jgi:hypothetical protein
VRYGELVSPDLVELEKRAEELHREIAHDRKARVRKGNRVEKLIDERKELARRIDKRDERLDELEERIAKERRASTREALNRRVCIDGATTWLCNKLVLVDCRRNSDWSGVVNAADRTDHADDCGDKSSQAELFDCFQRGVSGCNPANPPGTGSHEGVNGGNGGTPVTSKFAVGAKLPHYFWGLDLSDPDGFIAACKKLRYRGITRPHGSEPWHINISEDPRPRLLERGLIG